MKISFNNKAQGGFTLIELIVVIVILGILAATALPKFASLTGDARKASLQAAKGSLSSASAMLHGKWLITPVTPIKAENADIAIVNGYPSSGTIALAAGLNEDFTVTVNGQTTTVRPKNMPANLNETCKATYTEANAANPVPVIVLTADTCE